jgi:cell division septation protein DedD
MLSKHPNPERDAPTTSPALARRRDHMLRSDAVRHVEPRLVPSADEDLLNFQPGPEFDPAVDEPDPEIPPLPMQALRAARDSGLQRPSHSPHRPRLWPLGAAAVAVIAIAGIAAWLVHDRTTVAPGSGEAPYVAAEAGPEKIRPQQEGGIEVPNQDIRVYNELNGSKPAKESEVLLPPPEAPITPPAASAESQTATEIPAIPSVPAPPLDGAPAAGTGTQPDETSAAPSASQSAATATVAAPVQTATTTGAFRIQLAAVKSEDAAQAAWKKLMKTHPDVLKGLKLNVVKVDRGADGALFRVQGGPFADRNAAENACGRLKQKSQACLVVAQ